MILEEPFQINHDGVAIIMNQINHDGVAIIMNNSLHSRRTCMACACEVWAFDHGLYRKLGRMATMVRATMDMGTEPAFL